VRRYDIFWSTIIIAGFINALDDYSEGAVLELPLSDRAITRREEIRKYRAPEPKRLPESNAFGADRIYRSPSTGRAEALHDAMASITIIALGIVSRIE
jgi:hypothetical protein